MMTSIHSFIHFRIILPKRIFLQFFGPFWSSWILNSSQKCLWAETMTILILYSVFMMSFDYQCYWASKSQKSQKFVMKEDLHLIIEQHVLYVQLGVIVPKVWNIVVILAESVIRKEWPWSTFVRKDINVQSLPILLNVRMEHITTYRIKQR